MNRTSYITILALVLCILSDTNTAGGQVLCSSMYSGFNMDGVLDTTLDPYCREDFVIDQVNVKKLQNGDHLLSLNVFNKEEAVGVLYVFDASGNRVEWLAIPGFRRLPDSAYGITIGNLVNIFGSVTSSYSMNDNRNNLASEMIHFTDIRIPAGGRVVLDKRGNHAIAVNIGYMALKAVTDNTIRDAVDEATMQGYIDAIELVAVEPFKNVIFSKEVPDKKEVMEIIVSVGSILLKSAGNLSKSAAITQLTKKLAELNPVAGNLTVAALIGDYFNYLAWFQNINYTNNRYDTAISYTPVASGSTGSGLSIVPSPVKSQPPVARIIKKSPVSPGEGDQVVFDSATSTDDKDSIGGLLVRWDFDGNGTFETNWVYQKIGKWAYPNPGRYTVRLEVRDSDWNVSSAAYQIDITSRQAVPAQPTSPIPVTTNPSSSSSNVTGISSTTINGVIIGPVTAVQNTQVMGMAMGCGIRAKVQNTTGQIKSLALVFNAFDSAGNGVGATMIQGLLAAKATQDKEAFWMDLGGGQVNCQEIRSFKLDAKSMVAG